MNGLYILLTVLIYFGILLLISTFTKGKSGNADFFRGGKQSPWYLVAFGMIGASLSGVSLVSCPGWVQSIDMTYMQMVFGYFPGYLIVAFVLLPVYYKLNLTSIYTYLERRFGAVSYATGSVFFLLSKMLGAAARLYLVCLILQMYVFEQFGIPYAATVVATVLLIWLYTRHSGIKTIVWTDTLQTFCLIAATCIIIFQTINQLDMSLGEAITAIAKDSHSRMFEFDDWNSKQHFVKQFLSGIFIVVVMTGLDQDMMQKNLTCKNLKDAQKDMSAYGFFFIPMNLLFLSLGVLLIILAQKNGIDLPEKGDQLLPQFVVNGMLGTSAIIFFSIGIISAAFSSADSALTALTTSFCVDILGKGDDTPQNNSVRKRVHMAMMAVFCGFVLLFKVIDNESVIDTIYLLASYTYGPLLGMFSFGLFTKRNPKENLVPFIAVASPVLCYFIDMMVNNAFGYKFGYEMLMINGLITFAGLFLASKAEKQDKSVVA